MKSLFSLVFFTLFTFIAFGQEWYTNMDSALEAAEMEHKPVIMVFQGSDWCAPCMKLDREVWSTSVFKSYSEEHYVMLKIDFPRRKKNILPESVAKINGKIAEKYNPRGVFPLVVVLDSKGKVKGESGYLKVSPQDYIEELNALL